MQITPLLFILFSFSLSLYGGKQAVSKLPKAVTVKLSNMNKEYLVYKPAKYEEAEKSPLIIFLHGSGEMGDNIFKVARHGIPKIAPKNDNFPFLCISPQCLKMTKGGWLISDLNLLLDHILKNYKVDKKRIYLTGLSMGGFGSWKWAATKANVFAAVAPICGGGDPALAKKYGKLPIWVFHGEADSVVKISRSHEMVDAIKKAGGNVKLTIYPGVRHDSWTQTYNNPELYKWFLSFSK